MDLTKKQKIIISVVFFLILLVVFGGITIGKYIILQQEGRYVSDDDLEELNNVIILAEDAEVWALWEAGPAFRAYDFEKYSSRYDDNLGYRYRLELRYSGSYK